MGIKQIKQWKDLGLWVAALIVIASLAGCRAAPASQAGQPLPEVTAEAPTQALDTEESSESPVEESSIQEPEGVEVGSATATAVTTDPATEAPPPQPVREGLAATDPGTVELASGKVQLVEFFAFW